MPPQRKVGRHFSGSVRLRPAGGGFQGMRLYRSDAVWQECEKEIRRCSDRLDEPNQAIPRRGCIPAEPAAVSTQQNHCTSHRDWRSDFVMAYLRICRWC